MQPANLPARARPRAVERRLRAALAAARGRSLRREPEPPLPAPPVPGDPQAVAARTCRSSTSGSLRAIGIDPLEHDIRFVEDDWESPTLGAWGLGWEVWCDGMEITQFTYFQQAGGIELPAGHRRAHLRARAHLHVPAERRDVFDIELAKGVTYGEVFHAERGGDVARYAFQESRPRACSSRSSTPTRRSASGCSSGSCRCPPTTSR